MFSKWCAYLSGVDVLWCVSRRVSGFEVSIPVGRHLWLQAQPLLEEAACERREAAGNSPPGTLARRRCRNVHLIEMEQNVMLFKTLNCMEFVKKSPLCIMMWCPPPFPWYRNDKDQQNKQSFSVTLHVCPLFTLVRVRSNTLNLAK